VSQTPKTLLDILPTEVRLRIWQFVIDGSLEAVHYACAGHENEELSELSATHISQDSMYWSHHDHTLSMPRNPLLPLCLVHRTLKADVDLLYPPAHLEAMVPQYDKMDSLVRIWVPEVKICSAECIDPFMRGMTSYGRYILRKVRVMNNAISTKGFARGTAAAGLLFAGRMAKLWRSEQIAHNSGRKWSLSLNALQQAQTTIVSAASVDLELEVRADARAWYVPFMEEDGTDAGEKEYWRSIGDEMYLRVE
jgi:hypothetical protein